MTTLAERLKLAMAGPPKVTGKALAQACNISAPSVSDWLTGKTKTIEGSNLLAAAKRLGVMPDWLATGRGPMRASNARATVAGEPRAKYGNEATDYDEAVQLIDQMNAEQLKETVSFMRWKLGIKAPPGDGQALSVAGK